MKLKIYNAGAISSEIETNARIEQAKYLRNELKKANLDMEVFNPVEAPFNDKNPTVIEIFDGDYKEISESTILFFDLSTTDQGTMVELGIAIERLRAGHSIQIYPVISIVDPKRLTESRLTKYYESPVGWNMFMVGALTSNKIKIFPTFKEAVKACINNNK